MPAVGWCLLLCLTAGSATPRCAWSQSAPPFPDHPRRVDGPVVGPLRVPGGVIPITPGAPPTGPQAPVPDPAAPLPKADEPLPTSPPLGAIPGFADERAITLQEAVAIALYTNRALATARVALQQAQARTGQARAELNPTLGIDAETRAYDAPTTVDFHRLLGKETNGESRNPQEFIVTPQFNPTFVTALTLPLDVSGSLRSAVTQAEFNTVVAEIDVNRVRNEIVYDVKKAFYDVLQAQAQAAVATANLNHARARLSDTDSGYRAGTLTGFDVLTAQRDVATAQQAVIERHTQVSLNLGTLKNVMGVELTTRLQVSDQGAIETPPGIPIGRVEPLLRGGDRPVALLPVPDIEVVEDPLDLGPDLQALLEEALNSRSEILEAEVQVRAARHGIRYARRSRLPSVTFSLSHIYSPNAAGFTRTSQGLAMLDLSVPIFDGGLARQRVREARAEVATAQMSRRRAEDQVKVEVLQAYIRLVHARHRAAVANTEVAQAREAHRLARVRYQTGVSPQLEVSEAQAGLVRAETNQVQALYDYNQARAQLDRAVGRYSSGK